MFDKFFNKDELFDYLSAKTKDLLELHNLDHMRSWLGFRTDVNIPVKFSDEFTASVDITTLRKRLILKASTLI